MTKKLFFILGLLVMILQGYSQNNDLKDTLDILHFSSHKNTEATLVIYNNKVYEFYDVSDYIFLCNDTTSSMMENLEFFYENSKTLIQLSKKKSNLIVKLLFSSKNSKYEVGGFRIVASMHYCESEYRGFSIRLIGITKYSIIDTPNYINNMDLLLPAFNYYQNRIVYGIGPSLR